MVGVGGESSCHLGKQPLRGCASQIGFEPDQPGPSTGGGPLGFLLPACRRRSSGVSRTGYHAHLDAVTTCQLVLENALSKVTPSGAVSAWLADRGDRHRLRPYRASDITNHRGSPAASVSTGPRWLISVGESPPSSNASANRGVRSAGELIVQRVGLQPSTTISDAEPHRRATTPARVRARGERTAFTDQGPKNGNTRTGSQQRGPATRPAS